MTKHLRILLIMIVISGCSAEKMIQKAYDKNPAKVAEFTAKKFPFVETSSDTIKKIEYEFIEVACPGIDTIVNRDTLYIPITAKPKTYTVTNTKWIATPKETQYIYQKVKDSAEIFKYKAMYEKEVQSATLYKSQRDNSLRFNRWILIALAISLILNFLFAYFRK